MTIVWRTALIFFTLIAAWQALSLGLGAYFAERASIAENDNAETALAWDPDNPVALARSAAARADSTEADGRDTNAAWSSLLRRNPASATAMLGVAASMGDQAQTDAMIEQTIRLNASNPKALRQAALHWWSHGQPIRAVAAWSDAMIADWDERTVLYPVLRQLLEDPRTRTLLSPYAESPPTWWDGFFRHVASESENVDTLRTLFALRHVDKAAPLSADERRFYVERLRAEGLTAEAYLAWVNGLDDTQRQLLGLLNNGSFETPPTGIGWDWRIRSNPNLLVETTKTYGTEGMHALLLAFRGFDDDSLRVSQDLFLDPGRYRLTGKVRPAGLKTSGGLSWVIDCINADKATRLGATNRFLGTSQWESFDLDFEIPADCARVILRLLPFVRVSSDRRIDGSIWFDAMRIQRLAPQPSSEQTLTDQLPAGAR